FGVYCSVNLFNKDRKEESVAQLKYAYADMDIAKKGDGQSREDKEKKKEILKKALLEYCEPTIIIDTSNGLQPLWRIEDLGTTKEVIQAYKNILKGIRLWGKLYGSAGDNVYDVSRIVRMPGYYHQKEEPYLCSIIHKSEKEYTYDELYKKFPYEEEKKEIRKVQFNSLGDIDREIEFLDIQDVVIRAFQQTGRIASFDKQGRLILDGRLTGTFQGKKDDRQYLASTSHEPFQGNKVTVVADILGITPKEARQWIIEEFRLKKEVQVKKVEKLKETVITRNLDEEKRFTWGTQNLNYSFAIIKETDFIVIGAKRSSGKTIYSMDMAIKNALMGHRVLYLSLEMDTDTILDDIGRKYAGWAIKDEYEKEVSTIKRNIYEAKKKEIRSIENLILQGIRRNEGIDWNTVRGVIESHQKIDMVFIDNLDLINGEPKESNNERQAKVTKAIMSFTSEKRIPVVLIHHYRKSGKEDHGMDELAGSGKVADNADRIVRLTRTGSQEDAYPKKYETSIDLIKGRGYPESYQKIYFIKGTFVDNPPIMSEEQIMDQGIPEGEAKEIFDNTLNNLI
ncbi:MAG: hypothetical protein EOM19_06615, partial [Candidatus Moranbacteria bacterium]|nr:hypothetical protein [Candidatus Moranbacteria bacterium]